MDIPREYFWWTGALSLATFVGSLLLVPWLVTRLPADYFTRAHAPGWHERRHPVIRASLLAGKNLLGIALVLSGVAMLVLPGQGILTILLGVLMLDFPRKRSLERWLVSRRGVYRTINYLRRRVGRPSLEMPDPHGRSGD